MQFDKFNAENLPQGTRGGQSIEISKVLFSAQGVIKINEAAAKKMELKAGCCIGLCQDIAKPEDWYIYKDPKGFPLRMTTGDKSLYLNHSSLVRKYWETMELKAEKTRFLVAGEPTEEKEVKFWCLLKQATI